MRLSGYSLPLERLSATSISTFLSCPEQFRQKYLLKQPETMSGERFMGIVTHKALDSMIGGVTESDAVDGAWASTIEREGEPDWYETDASEQYRRTRQMLTAYAPVANHVAPLVVASEERFEEKIAGVSVIGYVDRQLSDRILEVKTASQKVSKPKSRWQLQGRLYGLVSALPIEWHVITRQATPKVYTMDECPDLYVPRYNPDVTVRIISQTVERMNDLYARHGANDPWPLDGTQGDWSCNYCSFKKGCIAWT